MRWLDGITDSMNMNLNKPWDKLRQKEKHSKPETLPGLTKLREPQLAVEPWSLQASQWAQPGWGRALG